DGTILPFDVCLGGFLAGCLAAWFLRPNKERTHSHAASYSEKHGSRNTEMIHRRPPLSARVALMLARHFTFPSGNFPKFSNKYASEAINFRQSASCKLSFGAWALLFGSSMPSSRAGAPPNNSASGPTKPMVPPQPIAAGSFLNAERIASMAASNAGPVG